jgi:hypothetical protein
MLSAIRQFRPWDRFVSCRPLVVEQYICLAVILTSHMVVGYCWLSCPLNFQEAASLDRTAWTVCRSLISSPVRLAQFYGCRIWIMDELQDTAEQRQLYRDPSAINSTDGNGLLPYSLRELMSSSECCDLFFICAAAATLQIDERDWIVRLWSWMILSIGQQMRWTTEYVAALIFIRRKTKNTGDCQTDCVKRWTHIINVQKNC